MVWQASSAPDPPIGVDQPKRNRPAAIVYKKYKQRGIFAVACADDTHVYLIDAASSFVMMSWLRRNSTTREW